MFEAGNQLWHKFAFVHGGPVVLGLVRHLTVTGLSNIHIHYIGYSYFVQDDGRAR